MKFSAGTPQATNNGFFLQTKQYDHKMHLDSAHLQFLNQQYGHKETTDLGVMMPFLTTGYLVNPGLYELTNASGVTRRKMIYTEQFTWSQPVPESQTLVMQDLSYTDTPGIGGSKFKIKFNKRKFGYTDEIGVSQYDPYQLRITNDDILEEGDGFIYTVEMIGVNVKNKHFPKEYLRTGIPFQKITSRMGEYDQRYSDTTFSAGEKRFYQNVRNVGHANTHFTVTAAAASGAIAKNALVCLDDYKSVVEIYMFKPGTPGALYKGKEPLTEAYGGSVKKMEADIVERAWIPRVEAIGRAMVDADVRNAAIWSAGGRIQSSDSRSSMFAPLGLFHQLNQGRTYTYNMADLTLGKLEYHVNQLMKDRVMPDYTGSNQRVVKLRTGSGGMSIVKKLLQNLSNTLNLQTYASDGYIQGVSKTGNNFGLHIAAPTYMSYDIAPWCRLEFTYMPSLDVHVDNEITNPKINGYSLSSYMFIFSDITDGDGNIYEIVDGNDYDFNCYHVDGRASYVYGKTSQSRPAANTGPGFTWHCEKKHMQYWVSDNTQMLTLKPINPNTGVPFGESYFNEYYLNS